MLEKREFEQNEFLWRLSTAVTIISGLFTLIVFLLLLFNYLQVRFADPVDNMMLTEMRQRYASSPEKDEALAQRIRDLDMLNRKAYFQTQGHLRTGATMLLTGTCIFLIAFKYMMRWKRERPRLAETPTHEEEFLAYAESRQLITWTGVGMLAIGMFAALMTESALNETTKISAAPPEGGDGAAIETADAEAASFEMPAWEEMEKQWPSFRGPASRAIAHFDTAPTSWDVESGENIKWKTELAVLPGFNSPVVWEDRIYFSGAEETNRAVYCYDTETGELKWEAKIPVQPGGTPPEPLDVQEDTGYAAPSMAVHGELAFVIYANADVAAVDSTGEIVWSKNIGVPENHYGHSSSLIAYGDMLYVQREDNATPRLIALDCSTGEEEWSTDRETISWASPIIAHTEFGPQLVVNSCAAVSGYALDTGTQLWTEECLQGEVAPSPFFLDGVVFVGMEYNQATAIKLGGGEGGVQPEILWQYDFYLPEIASPTGDGERFYIPTASGELVALDGETGDELWVGEYDAGFNSSPIIVGDRVYAADEGGTIYIVKCADELEEINRIHMGEPVYTTPVFLDNRIYMRTAGHLYCIENSNG